MHRALALVSLLALIASAAPADPPDARRWIAIPDLSPTAVQELVTDFELRGTHGRWTLAVGDDAELARLAARHPEARALATHDPGEAVFTLHLAPGDAPSLPAGARWIGRFPEMVIVGLPPEARRRLPHLLHAEPGRILFHDGVAPVSPRRQRPQPAAPALAAPEYDDRVQGWVDAVDPANLSADVTALSTLFNTRRSDTAGGEAAQDWLFDRFTDLGLDVSLHSFDSNADNVVAELPGGGDPDRVLIVGAHYDSINFFGSRAPGADDNASGVAALLEIARILSEADPPLAVTVRFIAFASEEFGLIGSDAYSALMVQQGTDLVAMLNTDMNAYREAGDRLDLDMVTDSTTPWLNDLVRAIAELYVPELPTREGSLFGGSSDHAPFFNDGFPAAFLFEDTGDYSPYIHSAQDEVGVSANDFELARQIVRALTAATAVLAEPEPVGGAPLLTVSGDCPGTVTVTVAGATPEGSVYLAGAATTGEFYVPAGPCVGTRLGLDGPSLLTTLTADGAGGAEVSAEVGGGTCGRWLQAVDAATCAATGVEPVP